MKYPIEVYKRKQNRVITILGHLFIAGFGIVCLMIAFDLYKNGDQLIERLGQIILFIFGAMMTCYALTIIFIKRKLDIPAIHIDGKGITVDQIVKVGPISWEDVTSIKEFNRAAPGSHGLQRMKGIELKINNPRKYISLAKQKNKGAFLNLKIIALSWLYFGKIMISPQEVDIELEDLLDILQREYENSKTGHSPPSWRAQTSKVF